MNELSIMFAFILARFQANDLVNTVSTVKTGDIDNNKENIYPLVNYDLLGSEVLTDAIIFSFKITIVQQRDVVSRKTDSKLMQDTNLVDNLNETHAIASKFINYLLRQNNDFNIEADEVEDIAFLRNWRDGLDGVQFDVDLSIPNIGLAC